MILILIYPYISFLYIREEYYISKLYIFSFLIDNEINYFIIVNIICSFENFLVQYLSTIAIYIGYII